MILSDIKMVGLILADVEDQLRCWKLMNLVADSKYLGEKATVKNK